MLNRMVLLLLLPYYYYVITYVDSKRSSGWLESWVGLLFVTNILTKPFCYLCSNGLKTLHEVNLHNQTQTNINTLTIHLTTNVKSKRWKNGMGKEQLDQQSFWFHTFFLACSSQRGLSWMTSNTGTEHWSPPGHFAVHCAYRTCLESFIMSNICSIKYKKLKNLCSSHKVLAKQKFLHTLDIVGRFPALFLHKNRFNLFDWIMQRKYHRNPEVKIKKEKWDYLRCHYWNENFLKRYDPCRT